MVLTVTMLISHNIKISGDYLEIRGMTMFQTKVEYLMKSIEKQTLRFHNFYLFVFILWYSTEIMMNIKLEMIFGITVHTINAMINICILALLMFQMVLLLPSYKKRDFFIIAGITLPIVAAAILSGNKQLLSAWMFIVAAKEVSFENIIKAVYRTLCMMIPLVIFLHLTGVIEEFTKPRGDELRHSLGFAHPNQLGIVLFQLVVCHCYLHRNKIRAVDFILVSAALLFTYIVPNSQSACLSMFLLLAVWIFCGKFQNCRPKIKNVYGKALVMLALLCNAGSVFLSIVDVRRFPFLRKIDFLISDRFATGYITLQVYGIRLWGQPVFLHEEERIRMGMADGAGRLYLDNSYLSLLIRYGVISYFIFSVAYLMLMNYFRKKEQYFMVSVLFVFAVYGVMENCLFSAFHNVFLLTFADMLYEKLGSGGFPRLFAAVSGKGRE